MKTFVLILTGIVIIASIIAAVGIILVNWTKEAEEINRIEKEEATGFYEK